MRRLVPLCALLLGLGPVGGCVQLVAFEQPVIGQPDTVPGDEAAGTGLCDPEVQMGTTALCAESCEIDAPTGSTSCGERVALDGSNATISVEGMHEVELTITVCERDGDLFRIEGQNGAVVALRERALHVEAAEEANAEPFDDDEFLSDGDGCEERTLVLQTGRMGLPDTGRRLCSDHLVPVDGQWQVQMSRQALRGVELCFREPEES